MNYEPNWIWILMQWLFGTGCFVLGMCVAAWLAANDDDDDDFPDYGGYA